MARNPMDHDYFVDRVKKMRGEKIVVIGRYAGMCEPLKVRCPIHGEMEIPRAVRLVRGDVEEPCTKCGRRDHSKRRRATLSEKSEAMVTIEEFVRRANERFAHKYDYSRSIYLSSKDKIEIVCPDHGPFWQRPAHHLISKHGCPACAAENKKRTMWRLDLREFIRKSRLVHGDRYDYTKSVYLSSTDKIEIICHEHGSFWQKPANHMTGYGCSKCGYDSQSRKLSASS